MPRAVVELRFDTPQRKLSILSAYFPSGSSGEERQAAKFRFLAVFEPHLMALKAGRELIHRVATSALPTRKRPEELAQQPEEQRLSARRTRLDDPGADPRRTGGRVPPAPPRYHHRLLHLVEQPGPAWANNVGWRLDYHPTPALAATARMVDIHKAQRFRITHRSRWRTTACSDRRRTHDFRGTCITTNTHTHPFVVGRTGLAVRAARLAGQALGCAVIPGSAAGLQADTTRSATLVS